ncbi:asparagine synthase (glutamine-hydrolyzing) [Chitinophaga varians]|uniref:asparagine synthase (glutamine-hydrolyzing) n=1 Tax=Chitinophaga varians TaxID=2202339 RepID=A0A847S5B0_9BACT|nr:asparagine synthase (glutamine-hydrolyzing) [Chitinophaga varians]NLR68625.1 asparagine synthase (glutamine-hydrolyzing) [Chitinophaga varians]
MCGITGIYDVQKRHPLNQALLADMSEKLIHRGPDDCGYFILPESGVGLGFRRLSIIDLSSGNQPLFNEDASKVMICNGEIYNYKELRSQLQQKGHSFKTNCDVEVIVHLYEEYGIDFVNMLNGQFAFAIYDKIRNSIFLVRDHVGIAPLFYTIQDDVLIFGSEIKAILQHPLVKRKVNLQGLDQIFSFPGLVSPTTMFEGIHALSPGHYLYKDQHKTEVKEYWDLDYPLEGEISYDKDEQYYIDGLQEVLEKAVRYRLNADVPVGFYLSGGLDSSLVGALIKKIVPENSRSSFSITFNDKGIDEARHQELMVSHLDSDHNRFRFDWEDIAGRLQNAIYHAETPLKETYNTCSLALSEMVRNNNIKVILTGEGADELFAGYVGYRFDRKRQHEKTGPLDTEAILEQQIRMKLWGDEHFKYEKDFRADEEIKEAIYSQAVYDTYNQFNSVREHLVNKEKLNGRDLVHKRSYIDFKLRISDHLVADHGDRVSYANSIEARYPFLDIDVIKYVATIPPSMKLFDMEEKYILKKAASSLLPKEIINREKFSFVAPGSPYLMKQNIEWINDILSYDRVKRQGFFNPDTVERLKKMYTQENFNINQTFESDLLMIILTFGIFLDQFDMPYYN